MRLEWQLDTEGQGVDAMWFRDWHRDALHQLGRQLCEWCGACYSDGLPRSLNVTQEALRKLIKLAIPCVGMIRATSDMVIAELIEGGISGW